MIRTLSLERLRLVRLPDDFSKWLVAVLLAMLAVQTARLLWALGVPAGPLGDWRPALPAAPGVTAQSAIFASANVFGGPGPGQAEAALRNDLKLFGVRSAAGALRGGAIIQLADGEQVSVSVGEPVIPGVELVAVGFDYADVLRDGGRQRLFLDQDKAPAAIGGIAAAPGAPLAAGLAAAVSLTPRASRSGVSGVIVAQGSDPAAFARSGLRAGDVVVAVNGVPIASAEDLVQLQRSLSSASNLSLRVERGGAIIPVTLNHASNP